LITKDTLELDESYINYMS